jgi:histidinol phosphatase-like enzyme (inositol monophosphatase family)
MQTSVWAFACALLDLLAFKQYRRREAGKHPEALMAIDHTALLMTAHKMADAARTAILPYFRTIGLASTSKEAERYDPVTAADRASEQAMRAILAQDRPDDAILGEEFGTKEGTSGITWVLDPIDGTRAFVSGTPTWGVLIAARTTDRVILGIIDQPYIGERFVGAKAIAEMTGPMGTQTLAVGPAKPLSEAIIFSTFPEVGTKDEAAAFAKLAQQCKLTRYGMDCYAHALLAAGYIDLVVEAGLQSYDVCGPIGVIEAAGGIVTSWSGGSAMDGGQVLAAANVQQHQAALAVLKPYATDTSNV